MSKWLCLILLGCMACVVRATPVAVIAGKESVSSGERRFAVSLARHIERWYQLAGVPVDFSDDHSLSLSLKGKKVAVLVYMAMPTSPQMGQLESFVHRGGKLIVFYSSSPSLAGLMGMKTVGYQKGSPSGRWSQMHFVSNRPRGVPPTILQTSKNLFLVHPVQGNSQVLAWWHDRKGNRTEEPAWLLSPRGCWMTHVLLADGDAEAKGRMLLSLTAFYDPSLWKQAATSSLKQTAVLESRVQQAMRGSKKQQAAVAWNSLCAYSRSASQLLAAGKYFEAWQASQELRGRCFEVYGLLQHPRRGEIRAVWDHSGQGLYPGRWDLTCRLLKDAGISDLYVNVAGAGFAHYASRVLPRSSVYDEQGDQLAACIKAASPLGLRVHPWILCFSTEGATSERIAIFRRRGWLLNPESSRPWLDPSVLEVRAYLLSAIQELVSQYHSDGVHLDFVRYPDFNSCFGFPVKGRFERAAGVRSLSWPEDAKNGALRRPFIQWRVKQITDFVHSARRVINRSASGRMLTAAVYGKYPSCVDAVGQDWESWINLGLVDYVAPMNYTPDMVRFNEWVRAQARTRQLRHHVLPGIGVTAAESRLDSMQVVDQILLVRQAGCPGFALFDLDVTLRQEILPILRMGLTAP